jgi:hypothetical protein
MTKSRAIRWEGAALIQLNSVPRIFASDWRLTQTVEWRGL